MPEIIWKLSIDIAAPLLTQSASYRRFGLDAIMARSAEDDALIIPGTLIAGKLKHAWTELSTIDPKPFDKALKALGEGCSNTKDEDERERVEQAGSDPAREPDSDDAMRGHFAPRRKQLTFSDLRLDLEDTPTLALPCCAGEGTQRMQHTVTRIKIDEARGAAEEGALRVIEQLDASGKLRRFEGRAHLRTEASPGGIDHGAREIEQAIRLGLDWVIQLGSGRSTGFGRIEKITLERVKRERAAGTNSTETEASPALPCLIAKGVEAQRIGLSLQFTELFCFAETQPAENLFVSTSEVPGAAIKGALALAWKRLVGKENENIVTGFDERRPQLSQHFDRVVFRFAFPSRTGRRPVAPPLSVGMLKAPLGHAPIMDFALCEQPTLVCGQAPAFAPDWKDSGKVLTAFGHPDLKRELRVRTAIEHKTQAAAEKKLFAYEMVAPGHGVQWLAEIVIPCADTKPEAKAVGEQLADLLAELDDVLPGLGKTKAEAKVALTLPAPSSVASYPSRKDGIWVVALQTPALLVPPDVFKPGAGRDDLPAAFREYWQTNSEGALKLRSTQFFVQHRLAGGRYLWSRFQGKKPYRPWVLTEPGSVFVLEAERDCQETAERYLTQWSVEGLPLPAWARKEYASREGGEDGNDWRYNPFIPQNGYGEICLNLKVHWDLMPQIETEKCHARHETD